MERRPLTSESIEQVVLNNDSFFVNGGALIDDNWYESDESLSKDIARIGRAFIDAKKQVIVYGVSTNRKLTNPKLIGDYRHLISNASHFSVRDEYSKKELLVHYPGANIELVDDIVFAEPLLGQNHKVSYTKGTIGIIALFEDMTEEGLKALFKKFVNITHEPIRIINFYDENNNDARHVEKIKEMLGEERFTIQEISQPKNAIELKSAMQDLDIIISMRYHGTLFANAIGKRVISLDFDKHPHYYNKNKYLQENYNLGNPVVKFSEADSISTDKLKVCIDMSKPSTLDIKAIQRRASKSLVCAIDLIG